MQTTPYASKGAARLALFVLALAACGDAAGDPAGDSGTQADTSPPSDTAGPDVADDTAGPDVADDTAGPDVADDTAGPDVADDTAGPDVADDTAGPDVADDTAGPDDATDAETDDAEASWPFEATQVWADEGEALPPGAVMISPEAFLALSRIEGFRLITKADQDARAAQHAAEVAADEALVMATYGDHPLIDLWLPPLSDPGPDHLVKQADGSYLIPLPDGQVVRSNSRDNVVQAIAWSLRETTSRDNLERRFTSLVDRVPADARGGLATVATLGDLSDDALEAQVALVEARLAETTPRQILPQAFANEHEAPTGCTDDLLTIGDEIIWQHKFSETPIRNQGARGTCTAFAVVAGMETMVFLRHGVPIDLSEQELYSEARDNWLVDPADFHDGIMSGTMLHNMTLTNYRVDAEHHWPYNPSWDREQDGLLLTWKDSCVDYDHACSDTNHQRGTVCSPAPPPFQGTYCATHQPEPGTVGGNIGNVRVKQSVSLWNGLEPDNSLASIRAHIDAGHPVTVGVWLDRNFIAQAVEDGGLATYGWVEEKSRWLDAPAPHSMLVVGYVWDSELPTTDSDYSPDWREEFSGYGGGYFVLKNSWGCVGDKGHFFVSFDWLAATLFEAHAITDIGTPVVAPAVTLDVDKSALTAAGSVRVSATLNRAVVRYELYEGLGTEYDDEGNPLPPVPVFTQDVATPADGTVITFDRAFAAADNGLVMFVGWGYDTFGNRVVSNLVGTMVKIDAANPEVTLSAVYTTVAAPGTVQLRATATDDIGVTRVRFFRGLQLIGEDTTPPFGLDFGVGASQLGASLYVAMAEDAVGNLELSNVIEVTVIAPTLPPIIGSFTTNRSEVPFGGGYVSLSWATLGAVDVSIDQGIGVVGTTGVRAVFVTQPTTFRLTATNPKGTSTRDVSVTVAAQEPPRVTSLVALPDTLPTGGGRALLRWEVAGDPDALALDEGIGDVLGQTELEVELRETTTFTLTASNEAGEGSKDVTVTVLADTTRPTVSLTADDDEVVAPGTVKLTASAVDDLGVVRVELLMDGEVIAADASPGDGWAFEVAFTAADIGARELSARAWDAAENMGESDRVVVTVVAPPRPTIVDFHADPTNLPPTGGEVTLRWTVTGVVDALSIDQGVGVVTGLGEATVVVPATTSFTLTATNAGGARTATVTVDVAPDTTRPEVTLVASHDEVIVPATVELVATASDDVGVISVQLYLDETRVDEDTNGADGWTLDVAFDAGDLGERTLVATALDAAGNRGESAPVTVVVKPDPSDTTPPAVALDAPETVEAPGVVPLTAAATDDVGVTLVRFFMDGAPVGEDDDGADGWALEVAVTLADLGAHAFHAQAFDAGGNDATSDTIAVEVVAAPPPAPVIVAFDATPAAVPAAGGTATLAWRVTGVVDALAIDHGVGDVTGLDDTDVTVAITTVFTLTASNEGGQATAQVTVTVLPDTTAPTVSLEASAPSVEAPGALTLTATASDDVGVDVVELHLDGALYATDDDGADGWSWLVPLEAADVGARAFEAVARDAAGNAGTSAVVTVSVTAADLRAFVSPTGDDTNNTTCKQATPCKTITKAATVAAGQAAVVLLDGTYDTSTQGTTALTLPAGTMIEAANVGQAIVKVSLIFADGGGVEGIVLDRTAPNVQTGASIRANAGALAITAVTFRGSFSGPGSSEAIEALGTSVVTMSPGGVSDYTADTIELANVANPTAFILVEDTAKMTVSGGVFGGPGLGAVASSPNNGSGAALLVRDQGELVLEDVTLSYKAIAGAVVGDGTLRLVRTSLVAHTQGSNGAAIHLQGAAGQVPELVMEDATLDGAGLWGIYGVRVSNNTTTTAMITMTDSVIKDHRVGILNDGVLDLTATDSDIEGNDFTGIRCNTACTLDLVGGSLGGNATGGIDSPFGAIWLGNTTPTYHLRMRGVLVTGNKGATVNSTTNRNDNSGIVLKGSASSTYDLGTAADPGGNTFVDNVTGASTSNVWVAVGATVVVYAVGNTWEPLDQGADGAGHYTLGVAPCAPTGCDVGAGADGDNYMVTSGTLRLAE